MGSDQAAAGVSGSAGPNGAQNASAQLERCPQQLGIITLVESQDQTLAQTLQTLKLTSPTPVLKLIIQQSGCFRIVDRGLAMQTIKQERELTAMGETRAGSNMGKGQLVTADLAITPNILWSGNTGGGRGGLMGAGFVPYGAIVGAVAGSVKENSAQAMLTVTDVRSSEQLAVAEGTASTRDFSIGAALFGASFGAGGGGAFGAYSNTPEGKTVTAALVDAYNNVVRSVRAMPPLASMSQGRAQFGGVSQHGWLANGNLVIHQGPSRDTASIGTLTPGTVVTPTGKQKNGWKEVQSGEQVGWVPAQNIHYH